MRLIESKADREELTRISKAIVDMESSNVCMTDKQMSLCFFDNIYIFIPLLIYIPLDNILFDIIIPLLVPGGMVRQIRAPIYLFIF